MTKVMCASEVSKKESLEAFLACQLIPLNKSPGIRPIGIGEVLRRIMGKAVMMVLKKDVIHSAGALQVCAGQQAGVESAIHSMVDLFESDTTSAIIQIDATNAFNSLNRKVFLHNIKIICPELANFVYNCYTSSSRLFVRGRKRNFIRRRDHPRRSNCNGIIRIRNNTITKLCIKNHYVNATRRFSN